MRKILVCSAKGGVGKSLDYEEYISVSDGNVIQIGPYIENYIKNNKNKVKKLIAQKNDGSYEYFDVIESPQDLCLDIFHFEEFSQSILNEKRMPVCLMKKPAPNRLMKIVSSIGEIKVTKEHKFTIFRKGNFRKIRAEDIIPKKDYLVCFDNENIKFDEKVPLEVAEFFGYLMGDGYIEKIKERYLVHIYVGKDNEEFLEIVKDNFISVFGEFKELIDNKKRVHRISYYKSLKIRKLFDEYGITNLKSSDKFIPEKIIKSNEKTLSTFIRALYDCDGYVPNNRRSVSLTSKSSIMIHQLNNLLRSRFGIRSKIRRTYKRATNGSKEKKLYYDLDIHGEDVIKFYNKIGFKHKKKKDRLYDLVNCNKDFNTNVDVYPFGNVFKEIRIKANIQRRIFSKLIGLKEELVYEYEKDAYGLSKNMVLRFIEGFDKLDIQTEKLEFLRNIINSKYFFRRVEDVKEYKYQRKYVYDFQVCEEGGHFLHSIGAIISNSTTAINLSSALNKLGKDVVLVDCNFTTPNIGLYFGITKVEKTIHDFLNKRGNLNKAIYLHTSGVKIIPGSISINSLRKVRPEFLKQKLKKLNGDFLILDSSAGLGREALASLDACDELLVVVNPELPSVVDALKLIKIAEDIKKEITGVVVCRKRGRLEMKMESINSLLKHPIIGVIPEDEAVKKALVKENSVFELYPKSKAGRAYYKLACYLTGELYEEEKKSIFNDFLEIIRWK